MRVLPEFDFSLLFFRGLQMHKSQVFVLLLVSLLLLARVSHEHLLISEQILLCVFQLDGEALNMSVHSVIILKWEK